MYSISVYRTVKTKRQQQLAKIFSQSCPSGEFDEEDDGTDCIMMGIDTLIYIE